MKNLRLYQNQSPFALTHVINSAMKLICHIAASNSNASIFPYVCLVLLWCITGGFCGVRLQWDYFPYVSVYRQLGTADIVQSQMCSDISSQVNASSNP